MRALSLWVLLFSIYNLLDVVSVEPAFAPIATLPVPVRLPKSAKLPTAVLLFPVLFASEFDPIPVLPAPIASLSALVPNAVLPLYYYTLPGSR